MMNKIFEKNCSELYHVLLNEWGKDEILWLENQQLSECQLNVSEEQEPSEVIWTLCFRFLNCYLLTPCHLISHLTQTKIMWRFNLPPEIPVSSLCCSKSCKNFTRRMTVPHQISANDRELPCRASTRFTIRARQRVAAMLPRNQTRRDRGSIDKRTLLDSADPRRVLRPNSYENVL